MTNHISLITKTDIPQTVVATRWLPYQIIFYSNMCMHSIDTWDTCRCTVIAEIHTHVTCTTGLFTQVLCSSLVVVVRRQCECTTWIILKCDPLLMDASISMSMQGWWYYDTQTHKFTFLNDFLVSWRWTKLLAMKL